MASIKSGEHVFEIVESVPKGYSIWKIGKNMVDGYLPICQAMPNDPNKVNADTLKAIKIDGAQTVLAAQFDKNCETPEQMERYINRYRNVRKGGWAHYKREKMIEALPILRQVAFD